MMKRPTGFEWCPLDVWQAYRQQKEFGRCSHKLLSRIIEARVGEVMTRILTDNRTRSAVDYLFDSEKQSGIDTEEAVFHALHLAGLPAEHFINKTSWPIVEKDFAKAIKQAEKLRLFMQKIDHLALQEKADVHTNFSRTGRMFKVERLFKDIDACLDHLIEVLNYPPPEVCEIQPRKVNASRVYATTKAKILKRDCPKYYKNLTYQVIADLISVAENLDEPFTADDVRKA